MNVGRNRYVQSGIHDGAGTCRFECLYCFASDPAYAPGESIHSPAFHASLSDADADVVMMAADTELFHSPEAALATLDELAAAGKDLTFSTKMNLSRGTINRLTDLQRRLSAQGNILAVMVSIPLFSRSAEMERRVAPVSTRIQLVRRLNEAGLLPFVGIRPILPPSVLTDDDVIHIVTSTVANSHGYIIGPYWFYEDRFQLIDSGLPVFRRRVEWMPSHPEWYVYEDKSRERWIADIISSVGGTLHERSSEAVREIKRRAGTRG